MEKKKNALKRQGTLSFLLALPVVITGCKPFLYDEERADLLIYNCESTIPDIVWLFALFLCLYAASRMSDHDR